ncbi:hypothetical protein [Burkholderia gladioli]|uniref:hypothetical protein n=1 Tax=Burkholderia gladioli TaxID=28095 RepID=UPI00164175E6|nr:hypothetical protein [Burkholderia gladioli]
MKLSQLCRQQCEESISELKIARRAWDGRAHLEGVAQFEEGFLKRKLVGVQYFLVVDELRHLYSASFEDATADDWDVI